MGAIQIIGLKILNWETGASAPHLHHIKNEISY
jgi:hypothetical protein